MQRDRNLACTSNQQLLATLEGAYRGERDRCAEFLRLLAEVDARRLFVERGFGSLFAFCQKGFSMSEDQAYRRVAVARAGRKFPRLFDLIQSGELHMTGASKLAKHLTPENCDALLDAARHRTKAEIEHLIASRFPTAPAKTSIRRRPTPRPEPIAAAADVRTSAAFNEQECKRLAPSAAKRRPDAATLEFGSAPPPPNEGSRRGVSARVDSISPTSATSFCFRFAGSERAKTLLDRANDVLGPGVEVGEVFEMALELLVKKLETKKFKTTSRPRSEVRADAPAGKRYIPSAVKRTVYRRDDGSCTYVSADGRRCRETASLEFDHIVCVARGGKSTVENVRLRCRAHNQHAAEQVFGREFMERKRRGTLPGQGGPPIRRARESLLSGGR